MGDFASARKMKRTKREQSMLMENMNRDAVNILMKQYGGLAEAFVVMQRNQLAMMNILKRQRILDDFILHQELQAIEDMQIMQRKALVIDPNKPEPGPKKKA